MKALTKSVVFSRREKLLLGLLGSAMLFSFSFSYGAVNQAKVDSIMQTINTAANNFSSQSDRDTYYQRVYTGLSDAIDMLAVVRNNVGAMIGTAPVTVPPVTTIPPTGGPGPVATQPACISVTPTKLEIINIPKKPTTIDPADIGPGKVVIGEPLPPLYAKKYSTTLTMKQSISAGAAWCDMVGGGGSGGGCTTILLNGNPTSYTIGSSSHVEVLANGIIRNIETYDKMTNTWIAIPESERKGQIKYILDDDIQIPRCGTSAGTNPTTPPVFVPPISNSAWTSPTSVSCPTSVAGLQSANPSTYNSSSNTSGYQYANFGTSTAPIFVNVKDYTNLSDTSLPTSCTPGKKWVVKSGTNSCSIFSCVGSVTTPPTIPPIPASSDLGIFANDPIPAPCPANTKLMNEVMGVGAGAGSWIRRQAIDDGQKAHHVYRLIVDNTTSTYSLGGVEWGDYQSPGFINVRISPYPCDFPTDAQLTSAHGTDPVHWNGTYGDKCSSEGISGNVGYSLEGAATTPGYNCKLKPGVTYYVNISTSSSTGHGSYDLIDRTLAITSTRPMWGIYKTYEDYVAKQFTANISSQSAESLRQKVVNDYKNTGRNTDKPVISGTYGGSTVANTWTTKTYTNSSCTITATGPQYGLVTNVTLDYKVYPPNAAGGYYVGGSGVIPVATALANAPVCPAGNRVGGRTNFHPLDIACKTGDTIYKLDYPDACYNLCEAHGGIIDVRGDCVVNGNGNSFQ